ELVACVEAIHDGDLVARLEYRAGINVLQDGHVLGDVQPLVEFEKPEPAEQVETVATPATEFVAQVGLRTVEPTELLDAHPPRGQPRECGQLDQFLVVVDVEERPAQHREGVRVGAETDRALAEEEEVPFEGEGAASVEPDTGVEAAPREWTLAE